MQPLKRHAIAKTHELYIDRDINYSGIWSLVMGSRYVNPNKNELASIVNLIVR